jgi:predicted aconitase with swiveling domain
MSDGRTLVAGRATGAALVLDEPLSFWGGLDPATGDLIDTHHPQLGSNLAGRVLVMPSGRGSSSSSSVLAEALRAGTGPAAIVLRDPDEIVALGAVVARELYGIETPVVMVDGGAYDALETGAIVEVHGLIDGASVRPTR